LEILRLLKVEDNSSPLRGLEGKREQSSLELAIGLWWEQRKANQDKARAQVLFKLFFTAPLIFKKARPICRKMSAYAPS
jgi:hypothetical protein